MISSYLRPESALPTDFDRATLIGRVELPGAGAALVQVRPDGVYDLSRLAPTCADLLELADPAAAVRAHRGERLGGVKDLLANTSCDARVLDAPHFLAPCDLQPIKAAGVTFVESMLERVIEEQAGGDPAKAQSVRRQVVAVIGENLGAVKPGSPEAARLKQILIEQDMWSQYLEVGIGPDAEVFTKSQPMSAVGTGAEIGLHPASSWNNPEPEIVLAVDSRGRTLGATMGNDVNLRDFEGRSALLLGKSKDNTASCAIGPVIRLFDEHFGIGDIRRCELAMKVQGPDGFVLFLGTMFAPTQDRHGPGQGFTHVIGDIVTIATPRLGTLANRVNTSDRVAPWTYGTRALMRDLARRGLLG